MLRRLAAKQIQPDDVARVVINEPDQVSILAPEPEREDVRLPHLVGGAALKEAWLGRVAPRLGLGLLHQVVLVQRTPHGLVAARQKQHPPQHLGDLLHAETRVLLLQLGDLRFDRRREFRSPSANRGRLQSLFAQLTVAAHPLRERAGANTQLAGDQLVRKAFLQSQFDSLQSQLERMLPAAPPRQPPRGLGFLLPLL
jgi:hypothetical protein